MKKYFYMCCVFLSGDYITFIKGISGISTLLWSVCFVQWEGLQD